MVDCPECDGAGNGCTHCVDGDRSLHTCPRASLPAQICDFLHYFDLLEKGLPPVAGGALNQAASFNQATRFFRQQQAFWQKPA